MLSDIQTHVLRDVTSAVHQPPPTIASMRVAGGVLGSMSRPDGGHEARFTFDELNLPEGIVVLETGRHV